MLNIPDSVKALFKQDGVRKNFRAHFPNGELPDITNDNIVKESVNFTESICSQDVFKFGLSEASVIEIETVGVGNMYGMAMECGIEIDCSSLSAADIADIEAGTWDGEFVPLADSDLGFPFFRVPYGVFTVDSCPRNHEALAHRKVTAYSASYSDASYNLPWFPDNMFSQKLDIDPSAFIAQITRIGLTEVSTSNRPDSAYNSSLFDQNGAAYSLTTVYLASVRNVSPTNSISEPSFVETDLDWDTKAWRNFGNDIADQLTALGYDLTYNAKKQKVFFDNREAVENAVPVLFGPTVAVIGYSQAFHRPLYWQHIEKNKLYPVLTRYRPNRTPQGAFRSFDSYPWINGSPSGQSVMYLHTLKNNPTIRLLNSNSETVETITPGLEMPELRSDASVKYYQYNTLLFPRIAIDSNGVSRVESSRYYNGSQYKTVNKDVFSFVDALDKIKITNAIAELNALFGRVNRKGEAEFIRLDNSSPHTIPPGEYMSLWWDEFEVEPIGTVRYGYEAEEEQVIVDYNFGDGASLYDMSDNEAFRLASGADQASVVLALDTDFVPHLAPINFVPIDFEMKGLPYLEAGDALAITAQDGTVVNSYALRIEISGVQALQMKIESQSGLIIDSGEAAT